MNKERKMQGDNLQESEDFILEIDDAVDTFFNHYEANVPKMGDALSDSETDTVSEEENALELEDSLQALESDDVLGEELALEPEDSLQALESDDVSGEELALDPEDSLLTLDLDDVLGEENVLESDDSSTQSETDIVPEMEDTLDLGNFLQDSESGNASGGESALGSDDSLQTLEFDAVLEEENVLEPGDSLQQSEADAGPVEENVLESGDFLKEPETDAASEEESSLELEGSSHKPEPDTTPEKKNFHDDDESSFDPLFDLLDDTEASASKGYAKSSSYLTGKKTKESEKTLKLFNSLTEAILTIDWEVNDANVKKAGIVLEHIQDEFPILKEPRPQEVVDGMMTILDALSVSPQRVPTTALSKLGKAISILRGIAFGALTDDGFDELIEDAIKGLAACKPKDEPAKGGAAVSQSPKPSSEKILDDSATTSIETESADGGGRNVLKNGEPEPVAVPQGVSQALRHHSEVVALLETRVRRLSDMYSAVQGAESMHTLLQKISRLLELQKWAIQDAFSLNCTIAVFPIGQVKNLSEFIVFQRKAMGVCLKYIRSLESKCKRQSRLGKGRQSIYLLRIALEKQLGALSRKNMVGNAASGKKGVKTSAALTAVVREHMRAMEECMERAAFIAECNGEYDPEEITEAGRLLREKMASQMDILRRSLA